MASSLLAIGLLLAASCMAQVVTSPPIEMLGPLTNDFPRRGPAIAPEDTWEGLTAGRNLALGKPYRFSREPNYGSTRDEGDATQLTDGEIIEGDHIWYYKKAVGYAGCEPPAIVCIDLGEVQAIDAVSMVWSYSTLCPICRCPRTWPGASALPCATRGRTSPARLLSTSPCRWG